jgi:hypothetical protein
MRVYETCETTCSERKLEIVSAGEHDELTALGVTRRARIEALSEVVEELQRGAPDHGEWQRAYGSLQQSARSVLRRCAAEARAAQRLPEDAESVIVWRCPQCGGLDAPQECIGVCIWRPSEWVNVNLYEAELSRAQLDFELERSLLGLVARLAFVAPREGEWERCWRAFESEARLAGAVAAAG